MLRVVEQNSWIDVEAMVPPRAQEMLLDVVFHTREGSIRFTGKDHILKDDDEAFSLAIFEHKAEGWWAENNAWTPMNLKKQWESASLLSLIEGPRQVLFYSDPLLRSRSLAKKGLLDDCSAIVFVKTIDNGTKKLVIRASSKSPCAVEVGISMTECAFLLEGLEPITLSTDACR